MIRIGKPAAIATLWCLTAVGAYFIGRKHPEPIPLSSPNGLAQSGTNRAGNPSGLGGSALSAEAVERGSAHPLSGGVQSGSRAMRALLDYAEFGGDGDVPRNLHEIAAGMDIEQVHAALDAMAELTPSPSNARAFREVIERWGQIEPENALAFAAGIDEPKHRFDSKLRVMRGWGSTDPAGALAFLEENPDSSIGRYARSAVFEGLAKGDVGVALSFFGNLNGKESPHSRATYESVRDLFLRDDRQVIAWAEKLPAGDVRDRAIDGVIDQWARYDPLAAKAWMEKNVGGDILPSAQVELGESWARVDPQAAIVWAEKLDADPGTSARIRERIFTRWMQYDYESAANFLVEQEPSPQLDRAFEMYIDKARHYDPSATMAWAESITDPKRRVRAIARVGSVWKDRDKAAYQDYLQSSGLDKNTLKKLR